MSPTALHPPRARTAVCLALALLAAPSLLLGQGSDSDRRSLTVDEVLELAERFNPAYRQARNELDLTAPAKRAAWGAFLPSLDLSVGTGISANRQLVATDNFGNPIENPIQEWQASSSSSQTLSGSLSIWEGGRRFAELDQAEAEADARVLAAEGELIQIRAEVLRQYFAALQQRDLRLVEEELLEGRRLDLENSRRLFEIAQQSPVDVRAAELEVLTQERTLAEAANEAGKAKLALVAAIGDPDLEDPQLADDAPDPFDPGQLDLELLIESAISRNPLVLRQEAQLRVSDAGFRVAKAGRWPSLGLSFNGRQSIFAQEYEAFFDPYPEASRSGSVSLNVSVPLFNRFSTSNQIAQAEVQLRNAEETLRQRRLEAERDVRSRLLDLETAWRSYAIAQRAAALAEERLELAREEYRLASRSFTELQTDVRSAATERRALINARYAFLDALIALEEVAGVEIRPGAGS